MESGTPSESAADGIIIADASGRRLEANSVDTVRIADAKTRIEQDYAKRFGSGSYASLKTYADYRGASFPGRTATVNRYTLEPGKPLTLKFRVRLSDLQ